MKPLVDTQKLKVLRESNGWSQSQLSEMSHTSLRTIQRMEKDGSCSMESLKSVAAVFDIDFRELLLEQEQEPATKLETTNYSFWVEFQRIWFKKRVVFWAMNLSQAFLIGLLFSVFIPNDKEKLMLIITCMFTEVILWSIWGGYSAVRKRFIQKYGNILEES